MESENVPTTNEKPDNVENSLNPSNLDQLSAEELDTYLKNVKQQLDIVNESRSSGEPIAATKRSRDPRLNSLEIKKLSKEHLSQKNRIKSVLMKARGASRGLPVRRPAIKTAAAAVKHLAETAEKVDPFVMEELESMALPSSNFPIEVGQFKYKKEKIVPPKNVFKISTLKPRTEAERGGEEELRDNTATLNNALNLHKIIQSPAVSPQDKYKVLDARDKLYKLKFNKESSVRIKHLEGTCPDMCPEKERYMREYQNQVSMFEMVQYPSNTSINHSAAVKQYTRSSADQEEPLPYELRSVSVLNMTMSYLLHNIIDWCELSDENLSEWYLYVWDRTRAIRKELTQQGIYNIDTVKLVEQCARFHIHCAERLIEQDVSIYDDKINTENLTKCLQTLKYMYQDLRRDGVQCQHEAEFIAYSLLLNLNSSAFITNIRDLPEYLLMSKEISFVLDIMSSWETKNYIRFFNLAKKTTYLNACLLQRYFNEMRLHGTKALISAYCFKSRSPLFDALKLADNFNHEGVMECVNYYKIANFNVDNIDGFPFIIFDRNQFQAPNAFNNSRSYMFIEEKKQVPLSKIMAGGELPEPTFQSHIPCNSFTENGILKDEALMNIDVQSIVASPPSPVKPTVEVKNIFSSKGDMFQSKKPTLSSDSIFTKLGPRMPKETSEEVKPIVWPTFPKPGLATSVFGKLDVELKSQETDKEVKPWSAPSLIKPGTPVKPSIFEGLNIFGGISSEPTPSGFSGNNLFQSQTIASQNIFGGTQQQVTTAKVFPTGASIFGAQILVQPQTSIFNSGSEVSIPTVRSSIDEDLEIKLLEIQRLRKEEDMIRERKLQEEKARKLEEEFRRQMELKQKEEQRLEEQRKREEMRLAELKRIEELRRQEYEAEMRRREEERKRIEERKKQEEKQRIEKEKRRVEEEKRRIEEEHRREEARRREEAKRKEEERLAAIRREEERKRQAELEYQNMVKSKMEALKKKYTKWKLKIFLTKWRTETWNKIEEKKMKKYFEINNQRYPFICSEAKLNGNPYGLVIPRLLLLERFRRQEKTVARQKETEFIEVPILPLLKVDDLLKKCLMKRANTLYLEKQLTWKDAYCWKLVLSLPDATEAEQFSEDLQTFIEMQLVDSFDWQFGRETKPLVSIDGSLGSFHYKISIRRAQGGDMYEGGHINKSMMTGANSLVFFVLNKRQFIQRTKNRLHRLLMSRSSLPKIPVIFFVFDSTDIGSLIDLLDLDDLEDFILHYEFISYNESDPKVLVGKIKESLQLSIEWAAPVPPVRINNLRSLLLHVVLPQLWNRFYGVLSNFNINLWEAKTIISYYNSCIDDLTDVFLNESDDNYSEVAEEFVAFVNRLELLPRDDVVHRPTRDRNYIRDLKTCLQQLKLPSWPLETPKSCHQLNYRIHQYCKKVCNEDNVERKHLKWSLYQSIKRELLYKGLDIYCDEDINLILLHFPWIEVFQKFSLTRLKLADTKDRLGYEITVLYNPATLQQFYYEQSLVNPLLKKPKKQLLEAFEDLQKYEINEPNICNDSIVHAYTVAIEQDKQESNKRKRKSSVTEYLNEFFSNKKLSINEETHVNKENKENLDKTFDNLEEKLENLQKRMKINMELLNKVTTNEELKIK